MQFPSRQTSILLILRYRFALVASLVLVISWSVLSGVHKGQPVVIARHELLAGAIIRSGDVAIAYIDGSSSTSYVASAIDAIGRRISSSTKVGLPLLQSQLRPSQTATDRIVINLPLESGDRGSYPQGTAVHLWSLGENFSELISVDAVVVESLTESNASPRITVSIPRSDENAVMQAVAVRVGVLS